jgi:hypothetical protein
LKVGKESKNKNKSEEKAMRRILFLLGIVVLFVSISLGQATFTSAATGNWNSSSSWTITSGSDSDGDGIPDANDDVIIQSAHKITLNGDAACNNLTLQVTPTGTRLEIGNYVLTVYGTLSANATTNVSNTLITTGTGKLIFVGTSRPLFGSIWSASPPGWRFEVFLNSGATGTASTNVKGGDIIITSGTFSVGTSASKRDLRPDGGSPNTGDLTVYFGATLIVSGNISRTSTPTAQCNSITINGTLEIGGTNMSALNTTVNSGGILRSTTTSAFTVTGNLTISDYATLGIAHPSGVDGITVSGTKFFDPNANFEFNGTSAQITGTSMPTTVNDLVINNPAGVTLSNSTTANGTLIFTAGKLNTGNNTLKVTGSISGAGAGKFVDGNLVLPVSSPDLKKWETGQGNDYLPLTINFTSLNGSGDVTVTVLDRTSTPPGGDIGSNKVLKRYFRVTQTGITSFNANLTLTYTDADVSEQGITDENSLRVFQWDGAQWKELTVIDRDVNNNTITVTGVTSFSDFVISGTGDAPLPVQVASVLADVSGRDVKIKIKTQTERDDFLGFNVYRSRDGENFVMVGSYESVSSLRAKGNMAYGGEYEFVDKGLNSGRYQYKIEAVSRSEKKFVGDVISVEVDVPKGYALHQNYPNPFNPVTVIEFEIPEAGYVLIELYNSVGQKVRDIFAGELPAGYHRVRFDASGLSSGVYFYRMSAGKFNAVRKMVIMK